MNEFTYYTRKGYEHIGQGAGLEITDSAIFPDRIGHFGATLGAGNAMLYYPEKDVIIVLCSSFGRYIDGPLATAFSGKHIGESGSLLGELEQLLFQ